ncbi:hypothetical protein MPSEU_000409700 [Mayamaea pseudoterrestris]|nr:hypothetical protein MPSEU_000409700 [Mayamaea pseudoterrestris]
MYRGLRDYMEDDFFVASDFAAVFDGHGGEAVSKYLRQNLYASMQACLPSSVKKSSSSSGGSLDPKSLDVLADSLTTNESTAAAAAASPVTLKDYEKALVRALNKVDRQVLRISHWSFQGSTAVACWILPLDLVDEKGDNEEEDLQSEDPRTDASSQTDNDATTSTQQRLPSRRTHTLLTANIGDSRAVLSRNKTSIIELTRDHKPNDPLEQQRIERVGGTIVWHGSIDRHGNPVPGTGVWRVNGNLALARAIGDRSERPAVTSEPELSIIQLSKDDDFVIIATDGLWDVMSSCDCVAFVHALIEEAEEMGPVDYDAIAIMLVEEALRRGSYDNITVVMMWL